MQGGKAAWKISWSSAQPEDKQEGPQTMDQGTCVKSHSSRLQKRTQTPNPAPEPSPRRPQPDYLMTFPLSCLKGHLSHQEDSRGLVGCPGPQKHYGGGDNWCCGRRDSYERAVGGREARRQMIKLVALSIKDTGWLSPLIHQWVIVCEQEAQPWTVLWKRTVRNLSGLCVLFEHQKQKEQ